MEFLEMETDSACMRSWLRLELRFDVARVRFEYVVSSQTYFLEISRLDILFVFWVEAY
jgi:hypothetical protein